MDTFLYAISFFLTRIENNLHEEHTLSFLPLATMEQE